MTGGGYSPLYGEEITLSEFKPFTGGTGVTGYGEIINMSEFAPGGTAGKEGVPGRYSVNDIMQKAYDTLGIVNDKGVILSFEEILNQLMAFHYTPHLGAGLALGGTAFYLMANPDVLKALFSAIGNLPPDTFNPQLKLGV